MTENNIFINFILTAGMKFIKAMGALFIRLIMFILLT